MSGSIGFVTLKNAQEHQEIISYDAFVALLFKMHPDVQYMKMHAALGVCGEAGELADAVKKECVYNKPPDITNLIEELGDLVFYMQEIMNLYKLNWQQVLQYNADKLAKRYVGLRYSDDSAIARADKQEPGASEQKEG